MRKINKEFFIRDTLVVAKELVGKIIIRKIDDQEIRGRILETEAYIGKEDQACHARMGKTKRNAPMFKDGGRTYVYLCYGLYNLLNIVTEQEGDPAAVLIRKIEPLSGNDPELKSYGPGNLTKYLKIDRTYNDIELGNKLQIVDDGYKPGQIAEKERVGIAYAGESARYKWRFIDEVG